MTSTNYSQRMQVTKTFQTNYRRLWSAYHCQRHRGKTHFQIFLELLAKVVTVRSISVWLMKIALRYHGIHSVSGLAEALKMRRARIPHTQRHEILSGRFFVDVDDGGLWSSYRSHFGEKLQTVIADAEAICRHEFDLLGSGLIYRGHPIDWHVDPVSRYRWPKSFFYGLKHEERNAYGRDMKLPWELSRMQHLPTLAKAYRLTHREYYAEEIVAQFRHWLDDNPCPYGANWASPMEVAIRIVNIIWAYNLIKKATAANDDFIDRLAVAIFEHGQFILFNLEHGIRENGAVTNGNHYLTNIVALVHLGLLCPEIEKANQWRLCGVKGLVEEMDRQVFPDGVDFESSVAYHRLVLELFTAGALLCHANGVTLPEAFWTRLERMYEFVLYVTRPDGKMPLVGDADDGRLYIHSNFGSWDPADFRYLLPIGAVLFRRSDMKAHSGGFSEDAFWLLGPAAMNDFAALENKAHHLDSKAFPDAGLYIMRRANEYLLACCGNVGTKGFGNHKHNDLLSFELYAGDKAFIVDPGSYVYTRYPEWRNLFRSTKYHNTIVVDKQEQNRFKPGHLFGMTPDSNVIVHQWSSTSDIDWLDVEHTGYTRLPRSVRHRRTFLFDKQASTWKITDILVGDGEHTFDCYLHFDHGIQLKRMTPRTFHTCCDGINLHLAIDAETPLRLTTESGWVSRKYGRKLPANILQISGAFISRCSITLTIRQSDAVSNGYRDRQLLSTAVAQR